MLLPYGRFYRTMDRAIVERVAEELPEAPGWRACAARFIPCALRDRPYNCRTYQRGRCRRWPGRASTTINGSLPGAGEHCSATRSQVALDRARSLA